MAKRIVMIAAVLTAATATHPVLAEEQPKEDVFAAASVMDPADLDGVRGREGSQTITVATDQELTATVIGGSITADTVTTGGISFGEGALDGFGGIGVFNVVTGNNNSVQAAIGVTFNLLE